MRASTWFLGTALALGALALWSPTGRACPICGGGLQRTLADSIKDAAVTVIARRSEGQESLFVRQNGELRSPDKVPKTRFDVLETLAGADKLEEAKQIELLYFGEDPPEQLFLIQAVKDERLSWTTPIPLDDRAVNYVKRLSDLPEKGLERLVYFYDFLESENPILSRDAYDEISRVPYADIAGLAPKVDRKQMLTWIQEPKTPVSHRRLYMMLLGLVARKNPTAEEMGFLEGEIQDASSPLRTAMDATITSYLMLRGPEGMNLIEERILKNKESSYSEVYAAIMALRFHAEQEKIVPRERIVRAFHCLLDRSELSDLIIADLARMDDWTVMDRLVQLFKDADNKSNWVRVPVIQYLKACPLPKAEEYLDELAEIDPKAFKRAALFVPVTRPSPAPPPSAGGSAPSEAQPKESAPQENRAKETGSKRAEAGEKPTAGGPKKGKAEKPGSNSSGAAMPTGKSPALASRAGFEESNSGVETGSEPNRWIRYSPLGVGLCVFALLLWARRQRDGA